MNKSDSINKLSDALVKAQSNIGGAVKDANNPFFKSRYADLGEVIKACKGALNEAGISVTQLVTMTPTGSPALETVLMCEGEWLSATMPLVCAKQNDPQALGSAITYCRRYALQSALLIPAVDDDAEAAMYREETPKTKGAPTKPGRVAGPGTIQAPTPTIEPTPAASIDKRIDGIVASVAQRSVPARAGGMKPVFDVTIKGDAEGEIATASTFSETLGKRAKDLHGSGALIIATIEPKEGKPWVLKALETTETPW